jgi:scyllo-inositol 2-dehydrogenase (NADP+)
MTQETSDIRVALLGFGLAGAVFHAPFIACTPGMRLAAVVTSDPERSRSASESFPGVRVAATAETIWRDAADFDLAVVATPNRTHVPLALAALEAGLPVVVDKPLAAGAADGRRLVEEARRRGLMLSVFQNRRWDGDFLTVRRLLREDTLGEVWRFESRIERWRPTPKPGWRQNPAPEDAGGLLYDLGSHLIDQALVLFGPAAYVYAEVDCSNPASQVDDDVFVALAHATGVRSHLWMSTAAAQAGPRLRVLGSRAAYTKFGVDVQENALRNGERPGSTGWGEEDPADWGLLGAGEDAAPVRTEAGGYQGFYAGIARALRHGAPPPVDPADSVAVLEIIEAARRSAHERRLVELG